MESMMAFDLWARTRRFCDEHKIKDMEAAERVYASFKHQDFMEEIRPFIDMKTRFYRLVLTKTLIVHTNGLSETTYDLTDEQKKTLAEIDEAIESVQRKYGYRNPLEVVS